MMHENPSVKNSQVATLGGGCFWCMEAVFNGVEKVVSGYSGGSLANPTYEQVCTGRTGHAEVVQITFDPKIMGGRACIRGMRITVALVLNLLAGGMTNEEIIRDYPYLEAEDIQQVLRYASVMAEERFLPLEQAA